MNAALLARDARCSARERQNLSPQEWKFDDVPASELESCYLYEYAREFFRKSSALQRLRRVWKQHEKHAPGKGAMVWIEAIHLLETKYGHFPWVTFDYFPECAWQGLPRELRQQEAESLNEWSSRTRKSASDRLHIEAMRQCKPANIRTMEAFEEYHRWCHEALGGRRMAETEYGFFAIDWSFRDSEIKRAFNDWLKRQRQERRKLHLGGISAVSNRGGFRDRLRWLGALRVKRHYPHRALVGHADTNLKVDAPYSHYPNLRENAKKAEAEAVRLFPRKWSTAEYSRRRRLQQQRLTEAAGIPIPESLASSNAARK